MIRADRFLLGALALLLLHGTEPTATKAQGPALDDTDEPLVVAEDASPEGDASRPTNTDAEHAATEAGDSLEAFIRGLTSIPDTPATFALGIASDQIARPGSVRELGNQVLTYVDSEGNLMPGLALEIGPSLFARREGRTNPYSWIESFRISMATARDADAVEGTDAATLFSVGFRVTPVNSRDFRFNRRARDKVRNLLLSTLHDPNQSVCPGGLPDEALAQAIAASGCRLREEVRAGESAVIDHVLEEVYTELTTGWRMELAGAAVFRADAADWRAARLWLATEYAPRLGGARAQRAAVVGVAIDGALRDGDNLGTDTSLVGEVRAGMYGELETRPVTLRLQLGYRFVSSVSLTSETLDRHALLFGASTGLRAGDFIIRVGLNGSYGDDAGTSLALVTSLGWGSKELLVRPIFDQALRR